MTLLIATARSYYTTMAQFGWGIKQSDAPLEYITIDDNWLKRKPASHKARNAIYLHPEVLPAGATVKAAIGHGASYWSQAGRIDVQLLDGTLKQYFIKLTENEIGRTMSRGEYEGTKALHQFIPDMVPEPIGWGTYDASPNLHYVLLSYIPMHDEEKPERDIFCREIAEFHRKSQAHAPSKFGFHVTTCNGAIPQHLDWVDSWEQFLTDYLRHMFKLERDVSGASTELEGLQQALLEKVIPRLLRPLETGGNSIPVTLCHGDLWDGNVARRVKTGGTMIFDPATFWGHAEYDLHAWSAGRFRFGVDFRYEYLKHNPPSEPACDFEDRMLLYSCLSNVFDAILFPTSETYNFRELLVNGMRTLVDKFPDGYTGPHPRKGAEDQNRVADEA